MQRELGGGGSVRRLAIMGNLFEETEEILSFFLEPILFSSD